jgi:hypothetical protein
LRGYRSTQCSGLWDIVPYHSPFRRLVPPGSHMSHVVSTPLLLFLLLASSTSRQPQWRRPDPVCSPSRANFEIRSTGYLLHDAQSLETIGPFPTRAVPEARARLSHRRTSKQPAADLLSHPLRNALELLSGTAHRLRQLDVLGILTLQRGLQCHCVVNSCAQA